MCICKRMYLFAGLKLISPVLYFSKINKNYQNTKKKEKRNTGLRWPAAIFWERRCSFLNRVLGM